jgi:hypothetical protein
MAQQQITVRWKTKNMLIAIRFIFIAIGLSRSSDKFLRRAAR